jgi:hypothetical protein
MGIWGATLLSICAHAIFNAEALAYMSFDLVRRKTWPRLFSFPPSPFWTSTGLKSLLPILLRVSLFFELGLGG